MDIKYELLANTISGVVRRRIEEAFDELEEWSEATAMVMLTDIREIINDKSLSDSDIVEKIVAVYEKNNVDCRVHHVF